MGIFPGFAGAVAPGRLETAGPEIGGAGVSPPFAPGVGIRPTAFFAPGRGIPTGFASTRPPVGLETAGPEGGLAGVFPPFPGGAGIPPTDLALAGGGIDVPVVFGCSEGGSAAEADTGVKTFPFALHWGQACGGID